jgi:hypothetical protein
MESGTEFLPAFVLSLVFGAGVVIAVGVVWHEHRTRTRALDVLRIYAERGEEPPASVIQAVMGVSRGGRIDPPARRSPTRASHLSHAAPNAVFAAGLAALAWWRMPESGDLDTGGGIAILAALFFAASMVARLVLAYYSPANER